jgi:hypothetical protein
MSTNHGIFDNFPNGSTARADSPFAVVPEAAPAGPAAASPFTPVARHDSPFTVIDDAQEARPVEPGRPAKLPDRRKAESPFQVAEQPEGFGFDASPKAFSTPFEAAPAAATASPFSVAPQPAAPFAPGEPPRGPSLSTQAALAAFQNWQDSSAGSAAAAVQPEASHPPFQAAPAPQAPAQPAPRTTVPVDDSQSDSFSIRQLELRAVFGVDREMTTDEILQRARALPGMRNIARVNPQDIATIDGLKQLLPNLGFGSGVLKLYSGSVPLEFIREGAVMLAVQTDGGFAPGVRETLMLVARELGRN